MSIVLGKPSKANAGNWIITLPLDSPIPVDKTQTVPTERPSFSKPTQFTHRLIEYRILSQLPGVLKILSGEFNLRDHVQIQEYHQKMHDLIAELPPALRFENPDTQWDAEYPWIKTQREYACGTTMLSFLIFHRYSMFHFPQSRTGVIKSGIKVLQAQERHFRTLSIQHHKLYALAFFTLEAATAIMVVFIAYPAENRGLFENAMDHVKDGIARMNIIMAANPFARPAKQLIELLMLRAESLHNNPDPKATSVPSVTNPLPTPHNPTPPYTNTNLELKPESWQDGFFDFSNYTPSQSQTQGLSHSDSSSTAQNFDFTCGGIIGQHGPIATMIDGNFYGVPDTWDPMILLEREGEMLPGNPGMNSYGGNGYGRDVY
jgi:hypothetical protein